MEPTVPSKSTDVDDLVESGYWNVRVTVQHDGGGNTGSSTTRQK